MKSRACSDLIGPQGRPEHGGNAARVIEVVPVERVRPGDEVRVGILGFHTVSVVNVYDDGAHVVVYFTSNHTSYENRARDKSGANRHHFLVEQSLAPKRAGELVEIVHGSTIAAARMRKKMRRQQAERGLLPYNADDPFDGADDPEKVPRDVR